MTDRQRENVAKHLYDLSKIIFATAVVGNLVAWQKFDVVTLFVGAAIALLFFGWAHRLDGIGD